MVRPSASHKMTPEEEETYKKRGGLKENDTLLLEIIDETRNCLLGRETLKVVRVEDETIAASTPLKLKVLKREEFMVGDIPTPVEGSGVDAGLVFEAATWAYDVIKSSSIVNVAGKEARGIVKGTTWSDYWQAKEQKSNPVSAKLSAWPFGWELVSVKAECRCHYDAKPRSDSITKGQYLANVLGLITSAYTAPAHSLSGTCYVVGKVNISQTIDRLIPKMDLRMNFTFTEIGIVNHVISCGWTARGNYGLHWNGWSGWA